jgi:hypothetical protein
MQDALYLHLRILWGLLASNAIPALPPNELLVQFHSRFATDDDIILARDSSTSFIAASTVEIVRAATDRYPSKAASKARKVEEFYYKLVATLLARYGFWGWWPDLRDTPYARYNAACRVVAIHSFIQATQSHYFDFLEPDLELLEDTSMLFRMYDQFVHFRQRKRLEQELKNPGSLVPKEQLSAVYMARIRVR